MPRGDLPVYYYALHEGFAVWLRHSKDFVSSLHVADACKNWLQVMHARIGALATDNGNAGGHNAELLLLFKTWE